MWNVGFEMGVYRSTFYPLFQEVHEQETRVSRQTLSLHTPPTTREVGDWLCVRDGFCF